MAGYAVGTDDRDAQRERDRRIDVIYSYRSASIGSTRVARRAGR
jgi:hypothetical protein